MNKRIATFMNWQKNQIDELYQNISAFLPTTFFFFDYWGEYLEKMVV